MKKYITKNENNKLTSQKNVVNYHHKIPNLQNAKKKQGVGGGYKLCAMFFCLCAIVMPSLHVNTTMQKQEITT